MKHVPGAGALRVAGTEELYEEGGGALHVEVLHAEDRRFTCRRI